MGESAVGELVPSVKDEPSLDPAAERPPVPPAPPNPESEDAGPSDMDKDSLCPICMQIISDAFLTACGHSFCYMCIVTHLRNKSDCPCCSHYLTTAHIFPNFLLDKLLRRTCARQKAKSASPFEHLRQSLQQGREVSIKELDGLLSLLTEMKRKMEQEEAEKNMQILLDFLHCLREKKTEELNELQADLLYIKEDINAVQRYRTGLYRTKDGFSVKLRMLNGDSIATKAWASLTDKHESGIMCSARYAQGQMGSQNKIADAMDQASSHVLQRRDACSGSDLQSVAPSALAVARKRQVHSQFNGLQECYLQKRRNWNGQSHKQDRRDTNTVSRGGYNPGLDDFLSVLTTFTRYSRLRVIAELRHDDIFHTPNIVSSIEFDRDNELFATAGVSRRIKVFDFSSVVNEPADVHRPVVEMPTRSKLICLSWNKYTKNHIASSDYEGIVTVWDVNNRQSVMEYEEHEKRAWSVDFSRTEPSMLVSGSDDCKVKIWCTRQEASVLTIDMKANICSVKYNPGSSIYVAVGSSDRHVRYYDLRNISQPLHVFSGHRKAVSYVKFLSNNELASASTDNTLRLWDVKENLPLRTYRGHVNEKNFVGLSVNSEYIACGSETNEVFVYHKAISKPMAWHRFGSSEGDDENNVGRYFISAVCWKNDSPTMLTANSQGTIKVLVLAA
ncbi:E3 ubiquitin-protein ligase COP1-like [Corylus avellana]|uniref:E3 ubiquitin-protein ligase COP1-like n=1 Tax=Corylus avellana TaxID=13451 RepID=UPI00286BE65F|nr:E3 ubiquitin-protein ligase COP1-like [Corylus avellana]